MYYFYDVSIIFLGKQMIIAKRTKIKNHIKHISRELWYCTISNVGVVLTCLDTRSARFTAAEEEERTRKLFTVSRKTHEICANAREDERTM